MTQHQTCYPHRHLVISDGKYLEPQKDSCGIQDVPLAALILDRTSDRGYWCQAAMGAVRRK